MQAVIPVPGIACELGVFAQLVDVQRLGTQTDYRRPLHDHMDERGRTLGAQIIVRCAGIAAGVRVVHFAEEQAAVAFVEDSLFGEIDVSYI